MRISKSILMLISVLLFLMLLTACADTTIVNTKPKSKDPKDIYLSYVELAKNTKEYKIVYKMDMSMLAILGSADMKVGIFKKDDKTKVVAEVSMMGQKTSTSIYMMDNKSIMCTKGNMLGTGNDEVSCMKVTSKEVSSINSMDQSLEQAKEWIDKNEVTVTYNGLKKVIGRDCEEFTIMINDPKKLMNGSYKNPLTGFAVADVNKSSDRMKMIVCIDKKTGIGLNLSMVGISKSELDSAEVESAMFTMYATSYEETVDAKAFDLPTGFIILKAESDENTIFAVIEQYNDYQGPVEMKLTDTSDKASTVKTLTENSLSRGTTKLLRIPSSKAERNYAMQFELCEGTDCHSAFINTGDAFCILYSEDKVNCQADRRCMYKDGYCTEFECYELTEQTECTANKDCKWSSYGSYGSCNQVYCYDYKTQSACLAGNDCEWDSTSSLCNNYACYNAETKSVCNAHASCKWYDEGNYCSYK